MDAEETIIYLIELYSQYLDELNLSPRNDFTIGEMTAYVETLEILQRWEKATRHGLDFVIEDKYKIWNLDFFYSTQTLLRQNFYLSVIFYSSVFW